MQVGGSAVISTREYLLGYTVNIGSPAECCREVYARALVQQHAQPCCAWLACLNPHAYVVALKDAVFAAALRQSDWLIADGVGIVIASLILGGDVRQRVTGSDVFLHLQQLMNAAGGMSVFFLGSSEETLALIRNRMAVDYPNIHVAGTYAPPFKPEFSAADLEQMLAAVNGSGADVLWVGMTAPKQEKWIFENRSRLQVKFAAAIGAVFDFYTGRVKRSHPVFRRMGLEWLPRLLQQPRRLWRRMFISAPIFLADVFKARVQTRVQRSVI